jgi:hypothetical protein
MQVRYFLFSSLLYPQNLAVPIHSRQSTNTSQMSELWIQAMWESSAYHEKRTVTYWMTVTDGLAVTLLKELTYSFHVKKT